MNPHFETFTRDQVENDRYNAANEVARAGLGLLKDSERQQAGQLQALKNEIAAGKASGTAFVVNSVFDRLHAKYAQQATGQAM